MYFCAVFGDNNNTHTNGYYYTIKYKKKNFNYYFVYQIMYNLQFGAKQSHEFQETRGNRMVQQDADEYKTYCVDSFRWE